jgi:hypothetical protein
MKTYEGRDLEVLPKFRKTVPMNMGTRRHKDVTKYDRSKRKEWKKEVNREGRIREITARLMESETIFKAEELVMGLVREGHTLSEAILVAANACEKCRNVLAFECGLGWGYASDSMERKAHTECVLCRRH